MKKLIALILTGALCVSLVACGGNAESQSQSQTGDISQESQQTEVKGLTEAFAEQPVLLTSVGQSADVEMVKNILTKIDITFEINNQATSADLGDAKTLVLAVGGSSKGLGAAGIDADTEIARVKELVDAASAQGVSVIAVHIGGEARRGELSDKFIAPSFDKADYAVIVKDGDKDGLMAGMAAKAGIPLDYADSMAAVTTPLKAAFK